MHLGHFRHLGYTFPGYNLKATLFEVSETVLFLLY
jgi:hypothetical protein